MHLKQNTYPCVVFLIYTITATTLTLTGHRGAADHSPHDESGDPQHPHVSIEHSSRAGRHGMRTDGSPRSRHTRQLEDVGEVERSPPHRRKMGVLRQHSFGDGDGGKQHDEKWTDTPAGEVCDPGQMKTSGRFYIVGNLEARLSNVGYQSDSAVSHKPARAQGGQVKVTGQIIDNQEESWRRLVPVVECGDDGMILTVRRRRAAQLLLDRANSSALPLSQPPPQCGYSVKTSWRDLMLMAPYDACQVTREGDSYVLPLLWRGTPVKMSCPVPQNLSPTLGPSSFCCSSHGMIIRVQDPSVIEGLKVKVRGEWTPLAEQAQQCGYALERGWDGELQIAIPFMSCGVTVKDGSHSLSLQIGQKAVTLVCPVSPPDDGPQSSQPTVQSAHYPPAESIGPDTENLQPLPWVPPFYLAPPYYPHPTYPTKHLHIDANDDKSSAVPSLAPKTTTRVLGKPVNSSSESQPIFEYYPYQRPPGEPYKAFTLPSSPLQKTNEVEESQQAYLRQVLKQDTPTSSHPRDHDAPHSPSSDSGFLEQVKGPSLQSSSHPFDQYYHYYHLPKIPVPPPYPPRHFDSAPEVDAGERYDEDYVYQPNAPGSVPSEQSTQSGTDTPPQSSPFQATGPDWYQRAALSYLHSYPQLYLDQYFYQFPHVSEGDVRRLDHPILTPPTTTTRPVLPPLDSSQINRQYKTSPVMTPPPEQPSSAAPSPNPNPHPDPSHYHPYYHYYHMYYGPERSQSADGHTSPSEENSDPEVQSPAATTLEPPRHSSHPQYNDHNPLQEPFWYLHYYNPDLDAPPDEGPQATTLNAEPAYDLPDVPLLPYYQYYYQYYQPSGSADNPEPHLDEESETMAEMPVPVKAARHTDEEEGSPDVQQPHFEPFHSPLAHDVHQRQSYEFAPHPHTEEEAEERLFIEMADRLEADAYTPNVSPCVLGLLSDHGCSSSLGCCSYLVNECTTGQHFIFMVPDPLVEPTGAPLPHPSKDGEVSCTPQRLTSNPDLYTVPLDGCGVHRHVAGQTEVHLLEVQGVQFSHEDQAKNEGSPVRLMVECRSSPGSPDEVKFQLMSPSQAPPVQTTPATVTVRLRIATDHSFNKYHPKAHLPLSLIQGRPVYLEVSLLNPPEPGSVLLVHYCLAYTHPPYAGWMLIYDGCPGHDGGLHLSQPLTPQHPYPPHTQWLTVTSFLPMPLKTNDGGFFHLEDPEIHFLCSTDVCSSADGDCTVGYLTSES